MTGGSGHFGVCCNGSVLSWRCLPLVTCAITYATFPTSRSRASCSKTSLPLLASPGAFRTAIEQLREHFQGSGIDVIAAAEARGFIFGAPLAMQMGAGFVPIRKPGKLPYATLAQEYQLEYGSDRLEVHTDALSTGHRVLLLDDVLATGGTMRACRDLVQSTGANLVACAFVIELSFLGGRAKLRARRGLQPDHVLRGRPMNDAWIAERMGQIDASGIRKAFEMAQAMKDPINLSIGLPDFDVAGSVQAAAIEAIRSGKNQYTLTEGIPELRRRTASRRGS